MEESEIAPVKSNAVSVIGRQVAILPSTTGRLARTTSERPGLIVAYDPATNQHTVRFDNSSDEDEEFVLAQQPFRWIVQPAEAAPGEGRKKRRSLAIMNDAVGRPLKVWSKKHSQWFHGRIVAYDAVTGKHRIKFNHNGGLHVESLSLNHRKWQYTDLKCELTKGFHCALSTSKYVGVQRASESGWQAYKDHRGGDYIGTFDSEKDAALAHDVYARKNGRKVNFEQTQIDEKDIESLKRNRAKTFILPTKGKSKYRGVHWQKNRKRWMARYSLAHLGKKNKNLGAFLEAEHAALAFDAEARRQGRPDSALNFPNEHPSDEQIEALKMNSTHYSLMGAQNKSTSPYRGVCTRNGKYHVQINIKKVTEGEGKKKGPLSLGFYDSEKQAALVYDRVCRQHGIPEKELNFPRSAPLIEVRLFDSECYICLAEKLFEPVATPCNHVFCRACIEEKCFVSAKEECPCCATPFNLKSELRPVALIPWPKGDAQISGKNAVAGSEEQKQRIAGSAASVVDGEYEEEERSHATMCKATIPSSVGSPHDDEAEENIVEEHISVRNASDLVCPANGDSHSSDSEPAMWKNRSPASSKDELCICRYPIGTRFIKEFEVGQFEGEVISFDHGLYHAHYSADGDEEDLSEDELDGVAVTHLPESGRALLKSGKTASSDHDAGDEESLLTAKRKLQLDPKKRSIADIGLPETGCAATPALGNDPSAEGNASLNSIETTMGNSSGLKVKTLMAAQPGATPSLASAVCDGTDSYYGSAAKNDLYHSVMKGAVGRHLKVLSKKNNKWYHGKIIEYVREKGKHRIEFDHAEDYIRSFRLEKEKWQYTDLIGERSETSCNSLSNSKFIGVKRLTMTTWGAFSDSSFTHFIGSFGSEREAANAYDAYAQKHGLQLYCADNRLEPADIVGEGQYESEQSCRSPFPTVDSKRSETTPIGNCTPTTESSSCCRYPVGTTFMKDFDGEQFEGRITSFDGVYYQAYYPKDGDREDLSVGELDELVVSDRPELEFSSRRGHGSSAGQPKRATCTKGPVSATMVSNSSLEKKRAANGHTQFDSGGRKLERKSRTDLLKTNRSSAGSSAETPLARSINFDSSTTEDSLGTTGESSVSRKSDKSRIMEEETKRESRPRHRSDVDQASRPTGSHRFPIGTCFVKEFEGHGSYVGRVVDYDGGNYKICCEKVVNEDEIASFDIIHIPGKKRKKRPCPSSGSFHLNKRTDHRNLDAAVEKQHQKMHKRRMHKIYPNKGP